MRKMLKFAFAMVLCFGVLYSAPAHATLKLDFAELAQKIMGVVDRVASTANDVMQKVSAKVIEIKTFVKKNLAKLNFFDNIREKLNAAKGKRDIEKLKKQDEQSKANEKAALEKNTAELKAAEDNSAKNVSEMQQYINEHPDDTAEVERLKKGIEFEKEQMELKKIETEKTEAAIKANREAERKDYDAQQKTLEEGLIAANPDAPSQGEELVDPEKIRESYYTEGFDVKNLVMKRNQYGLENNLYIVSRALEMQVPLFNVNNGLDGNDEIKNVADVDGDGEALKKLKEIEKGLQDDVDDQLHKLSLKAKLQVEIIKIIVDRVEIEALELLGDTSIEIARLQTYIKKTPDAELTTDSYRDMAISNYTLAGVSGSTDNEESTNEFFTKAFLTYPELEYTKEKENEYFEEASTLETRYKLKRDMFFEDTLLATHAFVDGLIGCRDKVKDGEKSLRKCKSGGARGGLEDIRAAIDEIDVELVNGGPSANPEGEGGEGAEDRVSGWTNLFNVYKEYDNILKKWEELSVVKAKYLAVKNMLAVEPTGFEKVGITPAAEPTAEGQ